MHSAKKSLFNMFKEKAAFCLLFFFFMGKEAFKDITVYCKIISMKIRHSDFPSVVKMIKYKALNLKFHSALTFTFICLLFLIFISKLFFVPLIFNNDNF